MVLVGYAAAALTSVRAAFIVACGSGLALAGRLQAKMARINGIKTAKTPILRSFQENLRDSQFIIVEGDRTLFIGIG